MTRNRRVVNLLLSLMLIATMLVLLPASVIAATLLAGGGEHALAILADGQVVSWGDNGSGQLGFGKVTYSSTPVDIPIHGRIVSVSAADSHVLALDDAGNVWSWGKNFFGQLGDGTTTDRSEPAIVFRGATQIAASYATSVIIDTAGRVWEWGFCNRYYTPSPVPRMVNGIPSASQVFTGGSTRIVIDQTGNLWAWGDGQNGKLGDGQSSDTYSETPRQIMGLPSVRHLDIGGPHVLAVDVNGQVWGWGRSYYVNGTFGDRFTYLPPTRLSGLPLMKQVGAGSLSMQTSGSNDNFGIGIDGALYGWDHNPAVYRKLSLSSQIYTSLSVGVFHALALDQSGGAWGWGANNVGQIGSINGNASMGAIVLNGQAVTSLSASEVGSSEDAASFFVTAEGGLLALGSNRSLQLALPNGGEVASRSVAANIPDFRSIKTVTAWRGTSFAVATDGSLYGWGDNAYCQLGHTVAEQCSPVSTPHEIAFPAQIHKISSSISPIALDSQGRVWSWGLFSGFEHGGENYIPGMVNGAPVSIDIAKGLRHAAVVANDGAVWTWGFNGHGQLGRGFSDQDDLTWRAPAQIAGLSGVQTVAAGQYFAAALDERGKVWAWGETPIQSAIVPAPRITPFSANATAIFAGESVLCAVLSNNSAECYGLYPTPSQAKAFSFRSPIRELAIGGIFHLSSVYFRLADGTVRAYGQGGSGQLGTGLYVNSQQPQLVVNEDLRNFLDLEPTVANAILPGELPPFLLETSSAGSNASRTISVELNLNEIHLIRLASTPSLLTSRSAPRYNVFVAAIVPGSLLNSAQPLLFTLNASNVWGQYLGGPLPEFVRNVEVASADHRLMLRILSSADIRQLTGTTIYVGYGTSDTEMLQSGRFRAVYTVSDPSPPQ